MIKQVIIRGAVTGVCAGLVIAGFAWVALIGIDKELDRQDAVRAYNCAHHGAAINKHAGKEICPPTVGG